MTSLSRFITGIIFGTIVLIILCIIGCSKGSTGGGGDDDGIAPDVITDLAIAGFTENSITLTWTASGDDNNTGTAARYELRIFDRGINWLNFDTALQVTGLPSPKSAGETELFEVDGLKTDSTYYFALKVFDEENNCNGISNCAFATCFNDFTVNIPDAGLLTAIRTQINKPTGDILKSDLIEMRDLAADDKFITDLTGLEYCTRLINLHMMNNSVSDLSPLSNLDSLVMLNAANNDISDISPLSGLAKLAIVDLSMNEIADISALSGLSNLTNLNLMFNYIVDITSLSDLANLELIILPYNYIRDITPLVNNDDLGDGDIITISYNPLEHESIMTHIPALRTRDVTVNWTPNILAPSAVADLAVGDVTATSVTLNWTAPGEDQANGIAYRYEVRYSTDSDELQNWTGGLAATGVPDPDTAGTTETFTVTGLTENTVYYFAIKTQDNSENWSDVSNIVWAKPYTDAIVTIPDAALEGIIRDALSKPTGDIYRSDLIEIDTLASDGAGISDLNGLEYCINLLSLQLINENISDLTPISGLFTLYSLNFQGGDISDVSPIASLTNLGVLQLSGNPVTSLDDLSSLVNIWFLSLSFVNIDNIEFVSAMTNLQYFFIPYDNVSDLSPLSNCTHLRVFYADNNSVQSLTPLQNLTELINLSLTSNDIEDIGPLVNNAGIDSGDNVALEDNPLSAQSTDEFIPTLQARGVMVTY